jgi:hypothetical protein
MSNAPIVNRFVCAPDVPAVSFMLATVIVCADAVALAATWKVAEALSDNTPSAPNKTAPKRVHHERLV